MPKYYVSCGSLQLIYSTSKDPTEAALDVIWECNENDTLDEYFYVDERGYRDYTNADKYTTVIRTDYILRTSGWELSE